MRGYYFITDAGLSRAGNVSDVQRALAAGVRVVQFRDKTSDPDKFYQEALKLRRICREARFLINDRVEIALRVGADGVHLGQDDLPYAEARRLLGTGKIIGLTVNSVEEAAAAQDLGADYVGVSPVFATGTKTDAGPPVGLELLRAIRRRLSLPLIAIGGITLANAPGVIASGADGLCAIAAVVTRADVQGEIEKFQELFRQGAGRLDSGAG